MSVENDKILFQRSAFTVTKTKIKAFGRTYSNRRIEKISVRRDLFWLALAPALCLLTFCLVFFEYLYAVEWILGIGGSIAALVLSWKVGILHIQTGGVSSVAGVHSVRLLREFQAAADETI